MSQQKRILVVDDDQELLTLLTGRLHSWGYDVLTASSGEEGFRIAKEQQPDLILLDIMMPKLKGRDLCELLKAHPQTKDIPVIFLTALSLPDHIKAGLDVGAEDYVVKPFQPEDLKDRIRVCLSRHTPQSQHLDPSTGAGSLEGSRATSRDDAGGTAARS